MDDAELLRTYCEQRPEDAFRELVRRHLPVVHAAALRQVNGDAHLAQDVAQRVFISFARKAADAAAIDRRVALNRRANRNRMVNFLRAPLDPTCHPLSDISGSGSLEAHVNMSLNR